MPVFEEGAWPCYGAETPIDGAGNYLDLLGGWIIEQSINGGDYAGSIQLQVLERGGGLRNGLLQVDCAYRVHRSLGEDSAFPARFDTARSLVNVRLLEVEAAVDVAGCGSVSYDSGMRRIVQWHLPCRIDIEWELTFEISTMGGGGVHQQKQSYNGMVVMEGEELR